MTSNQATNLPNDQKTPNPKHSSEMVVCIYRRVDWWLGGRLESNYSAQTHTYGKSDAPLSSHLCVPQLSYEKRGKSQLQDQMDDRIELKIHPPWRPHWEHMGPSGGWRNMSCHNGLGISKGSQYTDRYNIWIVQKLHRKGMVRGKKCQKMLTGHNKT